MKEYYKRWLKSLGVLERVEELNRLNLDSLYTAFIWDQTAEGYMYWEDVYKRINQFERLIERVKRVDKKAAKYLKKDMWKDKNLKCTISDSLGCVMDWSKTPQGFQYWYDIYGKLIEDE